MGHSRQPERRHRGQERCRQRRANDCDNTLWEDSVIASVFGRGRGHQLLRSLRHPGRVSLAVVPRDSVALVDCLIGGGLSILKEVGDGSSWLPGAVNQGMLLLLMRR